jgi:hypothetical protein
MKDDGNLFKINKSRQEFIMKSAEIKSASVNTSNLIRKFRPAAAERRAKNESFISFDDDENFNHVSS